MTVFMTFFSFKGCIDRPTFWRLFIALTAAAAALILFPSLLASVISLSTAVVFPKFVYAWYYIYGVFIAILYVASLLSIMTRRLHDLGFNEWWLIIFLGPLILPAPADEFDFMRWWPDVFLGPRLLPTIALSALIGLFVLIGLFPRKMGSSSPTILRSIVYCSLFLLSFAFSYGLLNSLGIFDIKAHSTTERIEDIIASIGNRDGSQVSKDLSTTFSKTPSIIGVVDVARRNSDGRFEFAGWAIDQSELEKPVLVFVIVPKKVVLMTSTGQKRDDVAEGLGFPKDPLAAGFSEVFDYPFDCSNNEQGPLVVAINHKRQFSLINPLMKASGC
jgi:uncharacterized membrane protein YhaH (DUF805 family)